MAMEHKQLAAEYVGGLDLDQRARLAAVNARVEVPALVHDDVAVVGSSDIVAYLERVFPERALYPADPAEFARARAWERCADTVIDAIAERRNTHCPRARAPWRGGRGARNARGWLRNDPRRARGASLLSATGLDENHMLLRGLVVHGRLASPPRSPDVFSVSVERSISVRAFLRDPVGRWVVASPTMIVFCAAKDLCGCTAWGRPSREDTARLLEVFGGFRHPSIAPRFDVVLDGRAIEGIDPEALQALIAWLDACKSELAARVRVQYGVIADSLVGVTLAGILPVLGDTHAFRVVHDPKDAFRALSPAGEAIAEEVYAAVGVARGTPRELRELRDLLHARAGGATIQSAARALRVSVRTLQRLLRERGTTFRDEVRDARFDAARELLVHGDAKVAAIAGRVGLSENALARLVRDKTGATPAELRKRHR
jgi:AraC-like DNA-binding protein